MNISTSIVIVYRYGHSSINMMIPYIFTKSNGLNLTKKKMIQMGIHALISLHSFTIKASAGITEVKTTQISELSSAPLSW